MRTAKTDQTGRMAAHADLSLPWAHTHFVGFVTRGSLLEGLNWFYARATLTQRSTVIHEHTSYSVGVKDF